MASTSMVKCFPHSSWMSLGTWVWVLIMMGLLAPLSKLCGSSSNWFFDLPGKTQFMLKWTKNTHVLLHYRHLFVWSSWYYLRTFPNFCWRDHSSPVTGDFDTKAMVPIDSLDIRFWLMMTNLKDLPEFNGLKHFFFCSSLILFL